MNFFILILIPLISGEIIYLESGVKTTVNSHDCPYGVLSLEEIEDILPLLDTMNYVLYVERNVLCMRNLLRGLNSCHISPEERELGRWICVGDYHSLRRDIFSLSPILPTPSLNISEIDPSSCLNNFTNLNISFIELRKVLIEDKTDFKAGNILLGELILWIGSLISSTSNSSTNLTTNRLEENENNRIYLTGAFRPSWLTNSSFLR